MSPDPRRYSARQQLHHAQPYLLPGRMNTLIDKIERLLISHYPWISRTLEKEIVLSFLLWGASHVLIESRSDESAMLDTLARVARLTITFMDVQAPG